ncbi:unnamed protein product [Chondrus crispus]|uniref:tRNA (guanine(9)-N(1))-methyltransferase n=1 Tax=Chondrus crispus TaxID=2769 RepID=R7Q5K4_CHOCR|nr:unnamed protein product [Chondrus crispus]CDF33817.1 unnamed protein product [Chondrus crispus]|eukprot:XP_005713636.1 unnamed protein product [Chondrus crispus]
MGVALSRLFWEKAPRDHGHVARLPAARGEREDGRRTGQTELQGISKNAQKKVAREKRLADRKKARKEEKKRQKALVKVQKRAERQARFEKLPAEERERAIQERAAAMKAGRAEEREKRAKVKDALQNRTRYSVCIDLGWNDQMFEKEQRSLARQLAYSYNALRKCVESDMVPLSMSIAGIDDVIKPVLSFSAQGWETWPVKLSENSLLETHEKEKMVYLTHDAEDVLQTMDPDAIYVVGGIVDRNRLRCATMDKATRLGIKTARLNLDRNISLQHGTPVLTVNHCVEILVNAANGMSWRDAYLKVLPVRKGISTAKSSDHDR